MHDTPPSIRAATERGRGVARPPERTGVPLHVGLVQTDGQPAVYSSHAVTPAEARLAGPRALCGLRTSAMRVLLSLSWTPALHGVRACDECTSLAVDTQADEATDRPEVLHAALTDALGPAARPYPGPGTAGRWHRPGDGVRRAPAACDRRLLLIAEQGDARAWEQLVDRHAARVWTLLRTHGLSGPDAAGVSQLVWLRLAEDVAAALSARSLHGWLTRTATREAARAQHLARWTTPPAARSLGAWRA